MLNTLFGHAGFNARLGRSEQHALTSKEPAMRSEDRDTRAVFGDYISVYDMHQAREAGATVAIYYESRLVELVLQQVQALGESWGA